MRTDKEQRRSIVDNIDESMEKCKQGRIDNDYDKDIVNVLELLLIESKQLKQRIQALERELHPGRTPILSRTDI